MRNICIILLKLCHQVMMLLYSSMVVFHFFASYLLWRGFSYKIQLNRFSSNWSTRLEWDSSLRSNFSFFNLPVVLLAMESFPYTGKISKELLPSCLQEKSRRWKYSYFLTKYLILMIWKKKQKLTYIKKILQKILQKNITKCFQNRILKTKNRFQNVKVQ